MAAGGPTPLEMRKFVAPELVTGDETLALAGQYAKNLGMRRALLVTDAGVSAAGWADAAARSIVAAGVDVQIFDGVTPNPTAEEVAAGSERYRAGACDGIVAVGGGSPVDAAKGIAVVAANGGSIVEYEGVDRIEVPIPPLVCAPTTTSSADVSQFAIITDSSRRAKLAIISRALVPDVSLVDPRTLSTMPRALAAATGLDAFTHAVEAFVSNASSSLTDLLAREAVRLIAGHLPRCVDDRAEAEPRRALARASLLAGLAFSNAILGAAHALAHSLGGFLDVEHGAACAAVLEHVVRFNFGAARERYLHLAEVLGVDASARSDAAARDALAGAIGALRARVGVTTSLAGMGVARSDLPAVARRAAQDPCLVTNPRPANARDLEVILEEAL